MWSFEDEPWQYRVLDVLPNGVDAAQLEKALRLTPSQRIDAAVELMEAGEALQAALERRKERP